MNVFLFYLPDHLVFHLLERIQELLVFLVGCVATVAAEGIVSTKSACILSFGLLLFCFLSGKEHLLRIITLEFSSSIRVIPRFRSMLLLLLFDDQVFVELLKFLKHGILEAAIAGFFLFRLVQ